MNDISKPLSLDDAEVVRGDQSETIAIEWKLESTTVDLATLNLPQTIWLHMSRNKEYPPGYRHAWGSAFVSTNKEGTDRFPVQKLKMTLEMPSPGGGEKTEQALDNVAEVRVDAKYFGAVFGDFHSEWTAFASHPPYSDMRSQGRW